MPKDILAGGILFIIYAFIFWALPYLLDDSATTVGDWLLNVGITHGIVIGCFGVAAMIAWALAQLGILL